MFRLQRLKNWAYSSVADDKKELNVYQSFQDQISLINTKIEEYIIELGNEDNRLLVDYNDEKIPINLLKVFSESISKNKNLSIEERMKQKVELDRLYYERLKQLKDKIVALATTQTDNVYLVHIHNCIKIINDMLRQYSCLLAIQKSSIRSIDNIGDRNAGEKLRILKDYIDIRTSEINCRLTMENIKR